MKLLSVEIKKHELLKDQSIEFDLDHLSYPFDNGNQLIAFIGKNGSGKTTFASSIAGVFHNIDRQTKRLGFDIKIQYQHKSNDIITLEYLKSKYFITIGENRYRILSDKSKESQSVDTVPYRSVIKHLPTRIITSAFSTRGEYEHQHPKNYNTPYILRYLPVSAIYGKNHYSYASISKALRRIMRSDEKIEFMKSLFATMGYEMTGTFKFKITTTPNDIVCTSGPTESGEYTLPISKDSLSLLEDHMKDCFYINSLDLKRNNTGIDFQKMSSGEKFFFLRLMGILSHIEKHSLIIIEEPEMHLNPSWIPIFMPSISDLVSSYKSTLLVISHSMEIIRYLPNGSVTRFHEFEGQKVHDKTFMASFMDDEMLAPTYLEKLVINLARTPNMKNMLMEQMAPSYIRNVIEGMI